MDWEQQPRFERNGQQLSLVRWLQLVDSEASVSVLVVDELAVTEVETHGSHCAAWAIQQHPGDVGDAAVGAACADVDGNVAQVGSEVASEFAGETAAKAQRYGMMREEEQNPTVGRHDAPADGVHELKPDSRRETAERLGGQIGQRELEQGDLSCLQNL